MLLGDGQRAATISQRVYETCKRVGNSAQRHGEGWIGGNERHVVDMDKGADRRVGPLPRRDRGPHVKEEHVRSLAQCPAMGYKGLAAPPPPLA